MENKKIKNIALLLLSVLPLKVLAHYFIYTSSYKEIVRPLPGMRYPGRQQWREVQKDNSFAYHIDNIFNDEVWLFIPVILFVLFIGWYFGLFDLKRNSKSSFSGSKVVSEPAPSKEEKTKKTFSTKLNEDQEKWLGLIDIRVNTIPFDFIERTYTVETLGEEHFSEYKMNESRIPKDERKEVALNRVNGLYRGKRRRW